MDQLLYKFSCANHKYNIAVSVCNKCNKYFCENCLSIIDNKNYCLKCVEDINNNNCIVQDLIEPCEMIFDKPENKENKISMRFKSLIQKIRNIFINKAN